MNCPYCYNKMENGVIQSAREVYFTKKAHKGGLFGMRAKKDDLVLTAHNMTSPTCIAFHCQFCKKIIIDYSDNQ